jgi:anti-sigma regulatory factor (Ser/Thr protein kinase)
MDKIMKLEIKLPRIPDIELVALDGLERLARHLGIAEEKAGEAKILVTEAIINALEHSGDADPTVRVEFTMSATELVIFVEDYGTGFDPAAVPKPEIGAKLGTASRRGWGLHLMKTMSDDFQIDSGAQGTRITLRKKLI